MKGLPNMGNLMKKAQQLQEKMTKLQEETLRSSQKPEGSSKEGLLIVFESHLRTVPSYQTAFAKNLARELAQPYSLLS